MPCSFWCSSCLRLYKNKEQATKGRADGCKTCGSKIVSATLIDLGISYPVSNQLTNEWLDILNRNKVRK